MPNNPQLNWQEKAVEDLQEVMSDLRSKMTTGFSSEQVEPAAIDAFRKMHDKGWSWNKIINAMGIVGYFTRVKSRDEEEDKKDFDSSEVRERYMLNRNFETLVEFLLAAGSDDIGREMIARREYIASVDLVFQNRLSIGDRRRQKLVISRGLPGSTEYLDPPDDIKRE